MTETVFFIFPALQTNITSQMWASGGKGQWKLRVSRIKAQYSRPTCKNCLYILCTIITVHNTVAETVFLTLPFLQTNTTSQMC